MVSIYACFHKIGQYSVKNPTILLASNHDNSSSSSCQPHALIIIPAAYSNGDAVFCHNYGSTTTVKFSASAAAVDSALCVLEPTSFIVVVACLIAVAML